MPASAPVQSVSPKEAYKVWSRVYDSQPNPMLTLEERYLDALLPPIAHLDVADLGCGTGRWLVRLAAKNPGSLVGVDSSPEMLERATHKIGGRAKLFLADCEKLLFPGKSADLILCSFVGSYVDHFPSFVTQIKRLLRPGGSVFFSDLHPAAVARFGWRRGFSVEGSQIDIAAHSRPIEEITQVFEESGLQVCGLWEPCFGEPEFGIFEKASKTHAFHTASLHPAIFILQLRIHSTQKNARTKKTSANASEIRSVRGARIALGPLESTSCNIGIVSGRIEYFGRQKVSPSEYKAIKKADIDLSGYLVLPGLINAHDHLEFALFPRLGKGNYRNFVEWARDIHLPEESPVREHRAVPKSTRLWWGAIRNLLCGVTTVCHHNPYVPEVFERNFPIRVLRDFGWAHSVSMDSDFAKKKRETPADQPFILHLAEGVDDQSSQEIFELSQQRALDDHTVIVHGIGLDERGKSLIFEQNAALVWCPTSNIFLFGRTLTGEALQQFPKVAIGSDSPLTASGDLLDELRYARETVGVAEHQLYSTLTASASDILRLRNGEGTLRIGSLADFIAVRDTGHSPAKTLASLSWRDIELVVVGGCVHLAAQGILDRLPKRLTRKLQPLGIDGEIRWIRAPIARLFSSTQKHLPDGIKLNGRKLSHVRHV